MDTVSSRAFVALMIFTVSFSLIACVFPQLQAGAGHMHDRSVFDEHMSHAQLLTSAVVPALVALALVCLAFVLAWFLAVLISFPRSSAFVPTLHDPPRRKVLKRTLFNLRSPPYF